MQDNQSAELPQQSITKKTKKNQHSFIVLAKLLLHTEIAHSFFHADWKQGHIGLTQFASQVSKIYQSSKADDPYADWYLMKTYDAIFAAREQLKKIEKKTEEYLNANRGMKIQHVPTTPWQHKLRVFNPFIYMGSSLLTDLDHLLCKILTMRHTCAQNESDLMIQQATKEFQEAIYVPFFWKKTKVTRSDIRSNNQIAIDAKAMFQDQLPDEILNQEIEFSYLPKIKSK